MSNISRKNTTMNSTLLKIGGIYNFCFLVFHIFFWKIFRWNADLRSLTETNRGIMQVLNLRLIYVFLVFGAISFMYSSILLTTELGKFIVLSISVFWFLRAIEQLIFFPLDNPFSIGLTVVCIIGGMLYLIPLITQ